MGDDVELIQFVYSHYNEKVRWALDYKGVPHRRTSLLPGPHASKVKKLTGQSQVPVLRMGTEIVAGSARIIDEIERRFPQPPLYPRDEAIGRQALEIQSHFDDEVGPAVRRAFFSLVVHEPDYLCKIFSSFRGAPVRLAYRASFPIARRMMMKSMQIDDPVAVRQSFEATERALDFVAEKSDATGYLAGDSFSVADLTAAALLAVTANPPHSPMFRPTPIPVRVVAEWDERWDAHPGTAWVRELYRRHRGAEVADGGLHPAPRSAAAGARG